MPDDKQDNTKTHSKNTLGQDDIDLWKEMTRDVERFEGRDYVEPSEVSPSKAKKVVLEPKEVPSPKVAESISKNQNRDLDRNTERRLKRGEIAIEGKLDLHGMNQGEARDALIHFIRNAQGAGKRCVLVVTGKGNTGRTSGDWLAREPGVLKRKVPDWLQEKELHSIVLRAVSAQPKHGGDGALYVYLRRQR